MAPASGFFCARIDLPEMEKGACARFQAWKLYFGGRAPC